ncbi:PH domain-containing protein [Microbacterium sp. W1N]|uniref:PH domain-containing protein n=1 Tax=Microbacterium festucae TaxID=2977531 RepID=UPI0021BE3F42|nr:PH domain-containing protein [Microbacterium festucae]MCT9819203.1 PH domain-containing protein [Microbacterium festucae]
MSDLPPPPPEPAAPAPAAPVAGTAVAPVPAELVRSPLSDGEWHRLHPLTPLLRGGLFLIVLIGIVVANLRDRLIELVFPWMLPDGVEWDEYAAEADPVEYLVTHELLLIALLAVVVTLVVLLALFWTSWRFHTFRITGDDVEVRSGVLFRTHRRAPLDRVQGVDLTRPMVARLLGAAKLEVVGAGLDSNVKLEYLSTANAETIRADILRLASGRRLGAQAARGEAAGTRTRAAVATVGAGLTGLIDGAEAPVEEPESVVHIPTGRIIGAHLLSGSTLWLIALVAAVVVGSIFGTPWVLFSIVPALIGFGTYWFRQITRSLRYAIAPTPAGIRITFGLFTTITETLPPGRIHAVEIAQPLLWRKFGWWRLRVNRLSGRSATDTQSVQFADVLPVGTRADAERVLRLLLPGLPADEQERLFPQGVLGPAEGDGFATTPRRARWLRPLSWRRNGFRLTPDVLLLRSGVLRRVLVVLPLARLQSVRISQGPLDRRLDVANLTGHTVLGQVSGGLGILDRAATQRVWEDVAVAVVAASAADRSHRWDAEDDEPDAASPDAAPAEAPRPDAAPAEAPRAEAADSGAVEPDAVSPDAVPAEPSRPDAADSSAVATAPTTEERT